MANTKLQSSQQTGVKTGPVHYDITHVRNNAELIHNDATLLPGIRLTI
jgi:hypothetical protein